MITYYFHIKNLFRQKYAIDENFYSITGSIIIKNSYDARVITEKINAVRRSEGNTDQLVTAGLLNALGLLHEIFHFIINHYDEKENPGAITRGINQLKNVLGDHLDSTLLEYIKEFPPVEVYQKKITAEEYLIGATGTKTNKEILLQEIILLNIENSNPAAVKLKELFDDKSLVQNTKYAELITETEKFFEKEKPIGMENLSLISFLKKPLKDSPNSLEEQLDYILKNWAILISDSFHQRLLSGKDIIYEDSKLFIKHGGGEKGTPPVPVYEFDKDYFDLLKKKLAKGGALSEDESRFYYAETEQFTADIEWMPKVVMIAKNAFVWLDQLSKKYQREIKRLDQIPDEELDQLARWNFTALWLIGLWERSSASKKIKQYMGNPEAAASAYSLYDYIIANELGGESAFLNLKHRAWSRGIRLSSDMVPNHTGIYSKWVVEKPDYFIQTDSPPFPGYQFNGPNLSDDYRVEVRIEDRYYSKEDAAVVFQRRDAFTGNTKYIYHGNDGTVMPWNDTAQLNLLNPEVRESLIQTIMHVARKTPIIRFDAAMTLAKKHYQRLWFPQPGTGGAIPSRSDYALTRQQFDEAMPVEFWREVVDRINKELPNTLLLAEAFWLMEGYFVRTLGMHRVYNSAFMHMMMKEENEKYKLLIKNTLEFNPEILKRYVNFMSNPDEETAVNQFGKGDKYFGIAVLMVTLPGLPMFAHGQMEGFSEKYGMEYKKAYYDEYPDQHLIWRHESEVFPLTSKRFIFSQVYNFELYDLFDDYGNVNDNVLAYSNIVDGQRSLIIYNNSYTETKGTINYSSQKMNSSGNLSTRKLAEALELKNSHQHFYIYRDNRSNLEYIQPGNEITNSGLYISLWGYQYYAFLDFHEVFDTTGTYWSIYKFLNGRGVHSIEQTINEIHLAGVHNAFRDLTSKDNLQHISNLLTNDEHENKVLKKYLEDAVDHLINELNHIKKIPFDNKEIVNSVIDGLESARKIFLQEQKNVIIKKEEKHLTSENDLMIKGLVFLYTLLLKNFSGYEITDLPGRGDLNERLMVDKILYEGLERTGKALQDTGDLVRLIKALADNKFFDKYSQIKDGGFEYLRTITNSKEAVNYINLHQFEGTKYFNREKFLNYTDWQKILTSAEILRNIKIKKTASKKDPLKEVTLYFENIKTAAEKSEYKFDNLKEILTSKKNIVKEKKIVKPDIDREKSGIAKKKNDLKGKSKEGKNKKKR